MPVGLVRLLRFHTAIFENRAWRNSNGFKNYGQPDGENGPKKKGNLSRRRGTRRARAAGALRERGARRLWPQELGVGSQEVPIGDSPERRWAYGTSGFRRPCRDGS